ncbi:hypothetical protein CUR178_02898 [Leishmania enriettii]|uniref:Uncharacterized protein n=1 Tax=Leishmania enriettii TaxID=5663 RepID=A0A836GS66_LEIEN|nr:hypothetical protein CUR178_02898 [Leishmania enriettii]
MPLFSLLGFIFGLSCLPVDLAAISVAQERIFQQERAIENGELIDRDIILEGVEAAAGGAAMKVLIQLADEAANRERTPSVSQLRQMVTSPLLSSLLPLSSAA